MSGDEQYAEQTSLIRGRLLVLGVLVVIGALALTTILLIASDRTSPSSTADTPNGQLGNVPAAEVGTNGGPVGQIAAGLVSKAFSFTPKEFAKQVAAARNLMTGEMWQQYSGQIAAQKTKQAVALGLRVTTSLVHLNNDPKKTAFIGVTSLTSTQGEFLMYMQRSVTTAGSSQAQATAFMLSVKIVKVGSTWMLSSVETI